MAAGLAGETPHMISAAVKGLARLAYEFSDLVSTTYNLLPSTFLLLKRKNREIAKVCSSILKTHSMPYLFGSNELALNDIFFTLSGFNFECCFHAG